MHFGEGNGSPLQRSCLENPRDGGAWWAAVSGVAQSQTRLKRLSSSSSSSRGLLTKDKAPGTRSSKSLAPVHFGFVFLNRLPPSPCRSPIRHRWTGFHTTGQMTHTAWSLRSVSVTLTTSWVACVGGTAMVSVGALPAASPPAGLCPLHALVCVSYGEGRGAWRPAQQGCWTTGRKPLPLPPPNQGKSVGCLRRIKSFLIPRDTEQTASGGLLKH